jgi:hypothetical protein
VISAFCSWRENRRKIKIALRVQNQMKAAGRILRAEGRLPLADLRALFADELTPLQTDDAVQMFCRITNAHIDGALVLPGD